MRRGFHYLFLGGSLMLLLLVLAACTDLKPVEDRIGAAEKSLASLQGAVTGVEGNVSSLQGKVTSVEGKAGKVAAPAGKVEFAVTGVEWKGSTVTKDLAAPTIDPRTLSDGYRYKAPGEADKSDATKWEVSTYVWQPGAMTVLQGDEVTFRIFIVNGDKHTTWVEGPDGSEVVKEQVQNRGREYKVTFTASKAGNYMLHCNEHDPTMHATITVLPRA